MGTILERNDRTTPESGEHGASDHAYGHAGRRGAAGDGSP